jgi:hypothetical protein
MTVGDKTRRALRAGVSALVLGAAIGTTALAVVTIAGTVPALAQSSGHGQGSGGGGSGGAGGHDDGGHEDGGHEDDGGGHEGGSGGSGGHGGSGGSGGHDDGGHEDGGTDHEGGSGGGHEGTGSGGQGQGGEPHGGQADGSGGRPPWAAEGIPEVELGRLNVARSPDQVFDRAYNEALAQLAGMAAFYNLPLDQMIVQLQTNWDNLALIDSPLQNLALLRDALDGAIDLSAYGISNDRDTLMAAFLGVATDKAMPVTTETVIALSIIMEQPMSEAEAAALAARAEAIRQAVAIGHG